MNDTEKIIDALQNAVVECGAIKMSIQVRDIIIEHLKDLNECMRLKADLCWYSPYEVGLKLVEYGQNDSRFSWGETIRYSPSEVEKILRGENLNDD